MVAPLFISFEGIDGSGKSTQSQLLAGFLHSLGLDCILTREPGGSTGAEEIRSLLVTGDPGRWSPETEILLFSAARKDHLEKTITPALAAGTIVITDRFADSTRVYQGVVRGDLRALVDKIHEAIIQKEPDLTFIIDMDPKLALQRGLARQSGEDRFEEFGLSFQQGLRQGFLDLAASNPARCKLVNGNKNRKEIAAEIQGLVRAALDP